MTKIIIYIFVILLFLQQIYKQQTINEGQRVEIDYLLTSRSYGCQFEHRAYTFTISDCQGYSLGSNLRLVGVVYSDISNDGFVSDSGFFRKKRLIIESILVNHKIVDSPQVWFPYLVYIFQTIKQELSTKFETNFDPKIAYLIGSLSLGYSKLDSKEVSHLFYVTGTQDLAAISGFNLNLIVNFFSKLFNKLFKNKAKSLITLLISGSYLLLVGLEIPLVRAFFMLLLSILSTNIFRRQNGALRSLIIIALCLIYYDIEVINSISFQLSFAATFAIIYLQNVFKQSKTQNNSLLSDLHVGILHSNNENNDYKSSLFSNIKSYIKESLKISICVQSIILPLVIYHFKEFSVLSIFVSVLLTWIIPHLVIGSILFLVISMLGVNSAFLSMFSLPISFLASVFLSILKLFDNQIFLVKIDNLAWWMIIIWWFFIIFFRNIIVRRPRYSYLKGYL